jgi:hypothetical protein
MFGEVTAIGSNPASFTVHYPTGYEVTLRVLDTTVFDAGRDRPYRFDLLKVGDSVRIKGAPPAPRPGAGAKPGDQRPAGGAGRRAAGAAEGGPVARRVTVLPAGEQPQGLGNQKAGKPLVNKKGGNNGPLQ